MSAGRARAAWALACGLAVLALWPRAPEPPCEAPRERVARGGTSAVVTCGGGSAGALSGPAPLLFGARLDANRAAAGALEALPGIGPRRAEALVRARPYCRAADLERAHGVGPVLRSRIEPFLALGGEACEPPAS